MVSPCGRDGRALGNWLTRLRITGPRWNSLPVSRNAENISNIPNAHEAVAVNTATIKITKLTNCKNFN